MTSYSQSDHILRWKESHIFGEISLQSVVKTSQSYFLCDRKSWKFSWNELFFPSLPSYFLFHNTCLQSTENTDKHSEMTKSWNFQTSAYQRLKSNFRVLDLIPIFLGLMCYTKIRKDENKLSIIDLTSYSQSDHMS